MKATNEFRRKTSERGVALLIAIFALVLISGVAVSLIIMSGTETAVSSNYSNSTQAFYAGYSGLEEARGRLWPNHPNTFGTFVALPGNTLAINQVRYILNPSAGETVNPANLSADNPYRDVEYQTEWLVPVTSRTIQTTTSVSPVLSGGTTLPGPLYKWVRINGKTEDSSRIDVDRDGNLDATTPIFYDGKHQNRASNGRQVLQATALAVMPNGSRRMMQYDIAPVFFDLQFPSALTFDGQGSALFPANSNVYYVDGNDHAGCGGSGSAPARPAVGTTTPGDDTSITKAIPPNRLTKYIGSGPSPDVQDVSAQLDPRLTTPQQLEDLMTNIKQNATQTVQGPATSLPNYGSQAAPTITYVDGNLDLSGTVTGYGILVVTGNFNASGTVGWKGIVLVVGKGVMTVSGGGNNEYDGAVFLANTRNADGTIRSTLGPTLLDWAGGGGNGVYYSSGCINNAQNSVTFRVLSFREIIE
jgi:hypothetical protein